MARRPWTLAHRAMTISALTGSLALIMTITVFVSDDQAPALSDVTLAEVAR